MADWDTCALNDSYEYNSTQPHSRRSSLSSGLSSTGMRQNGKNADDNTSDQVILDGGEHLSQESVTENGYTNLALLESNGHISAPGTAKARAAKSPFAPSTIDSIPEEEIIIPKDANISEFTKEQFASFLRCLKMDGRIISHLYRKNVDGKRFSRMKDSELEAVGMNNAVVMFFKERSSLKNKKKPAGGWVL